MNHLGDVFQIHILPPTSRNLSIQENGCCKQDYGFFRSLHTQTSSNQSRCHVLKVSEKFIRGRDPQGDLSSSSVGLVESALRTIPTWRLPGTVAQAQMHAIPRRQPGSSDP